MHNVIFLYLCDIQCKAVFHIALVLLVDPVTDDALSLSSFKITEPEQSPQSSLNPFHLSSEIKLLTPFYIIMSHLRWEEKLHKQDPKITENPQGFRIRMNHALEREKLSVQITLFGSCFKFS